MQRPFSMRNVTIVKRLNIGLFLVISIPILLICACSCLMTFRSSKQKISAFSEEIVTTVCENINDMITSLENHSIDIAYNEDLQTTLRQYGQLSQRELYLRELQIANACTKKFIYDPIVTDVVALTAGHAPVFCFGNTYFRLRPSAESIRQIGEQIELQDKNVVFYPVGEQFEQRISPGIHYQRGNGFVLGRTIPSAAGDGTIGLLVMKVSDSRLRDKYAEINLGADSRILIVNSQAQIVSSSDTRYQPGDFCRELELHPAFSARAEGGRLDMAFEGKAYLGVYNKIKGTDWILLGLVSYDYINRDSWALGLSIMGIGALCLLLASLVARHLSGSIITPLRQLENAMDTVAEGVFNVADIITDNGKDELGKLSRKFQWMSTELDVQMRRAIENEKQKRESEIRALQYQINPHFMSNTLNTIAYLAKLQGVENIERVTKALINLMLASSGKDGNLIRVEREMAYLQDYVYIQEFKFGSDVEVRYEVESGILQYYVPPFILQPILENALLHGIKDRTDGACVQVRGYSAGGILHFEIIDNGVGMDEGKARHILQAGSRSKRLPLSKIGIGNVNERIKILFGEAYGLTIHSVPGVMTKVTVLLPVLETREEAEQG